MTVIIAITAIFDLFFLAVLADLVSISTLDTIEWIVFIGYFLLANYFCFKVIWIAANINRQAIGLVKTLHKYNSVLSMMGTILRQLLTKDTSNLHCRFAATLTVHLQQKTKHLEDKPEERLALATEILSNAIDNI